MNNQLQYHLLPTEDASPLCIMQGGLCHAQYGTKMFGAGTIKGAENQHLYLTSDARIKNKEWAYLEYYGAIGGLKQVVEKYDSSKEYITKRKIEFTTDPKLIADGVLPIDGNTKAKVQVPNMRSDNTSEFMDIEVNFLTEFCKRWNEKSNMSDAMLKFHNSLNAQEGKPPYQKDNQKVDVVKLAKEETEKEFDGCLDNEITELEKIQYENGFFVGYNQALQSTGGYSLEDMRKAFQAGADYITEGEMGDPKDMIDFPEWLKSYQSLTPQPKGDIVIELNDGNLIFK